MSINRIYFLGKSSLFGLDKTMSNITMCNLNTSTQLYNINPSVKIYDYTGELNTNDTIYRNFYDIIRDTKDRVSLHESLFIFDLKLDFKKEYYSNTYEQFITYDILNHKILNDLAELKVINDISPLIHDKDIFTKEYVRDVVFFINFLELNNIHYLLTNIDKSIHSHVKDLHEITIKNII